MTAAEEEEDEAEADRDREADRRRQARRTPRERRTVLHLARHAEQEPGPHDDVDDQMFTAGDRPLSDRGRAQAAALADRLADARLDAVHASPVTRARETAEVVADRLGLDVTLDKRFAEIPFVRPDVTDYDTVLDAIVDFIDRLGRETDPAMAGDRPFSEVRARVLAGLDEVLDAHARPLVVAHGGTNRVVLADALQMPWARMFGLEQDLACLNVVAYGGRGGPVVRLVNEVPWRDGGPGGAGDAGDGHDGAVD